MGGGGGGSEWNDGARAQHSQSRWEVANHISGSYLIYVDFLGTTRVSYRAQVSATTNHAVVNLLHDANTEPCPDPLGGFKPMNRGWGPDDNGLASG